MDKIHQEINQHLEQLPTLFQTLADLCVPTLNRVDANEARTYVISAEALLARLRSLVQRFSQIGKPKRLRPTTLRVKPMECLRPAEGDVPQPTEDVVRQE
jgi:hypothetical protein